MSSMAPASMSPATMVMNAQQQHLNQQRECINCHLKDVTKLKKRQIPDAITPTIVVLCETCVQVRRTIDPCKQCKQRIKFAFKHPLDQSVRCINCILGTVVMHPVQPKPAPPPPKVVIPETIPMSIGLETLSTMDMQNMALQEDDDDAKKYLDEQLALLVGREDLKEELYGFHALLETNKIKEANNVPVAPIPLHLVLTGNPGTGKTTIARILANLLRKMAPRLVQSNKFKELRGQDLIAGYVGQTSKVVDQIAEEYKHGVVFLDEAYALMPGGGAGGSAASSGGSFASDAIAAIMKHMGDPDGSNPTCIWIFAGYKKEMDNFLKMNDGLLRRLPQRFHLRDYTSAELRDIFKAKMVKLKEDLMPPDLWDRLPGIIEDIMPKTLIEKTNAGLADQLYDRTNRIRAVRYTSKEKANNPELLQIFLEEDIKKALEKLAQNEM